MISVGTTFQLQLSISLHMAHITVLIASRTVYRSLAFQSTPGNYPSRARKRNNYRQRSRNTWAAIRESTHLAIMSQYYIRSLAEAANLEAIAKMRCSTLRHSIFAQRAKIKHNRIGGWFPVQSSLGGTP